MIKELQNVTKVSADLTIHSREMAIAINEQKIVLSDMGDQVLEIAGKGADYGFSLSDVSENIAKLTGSDGEMIKNLSKIGQLAQDNILLSKEAVQHLNTIAQKPPNTRQKNNQNTNGSTQKKGFFNNRVNNNE